MEPEGKKKPVWAMFLSPLSVIVLTIFLLVGSLGVLAFGNTQWSRWIYVFQAYYWPKYESSIIKPPSNYTGSWRCWFKNGQIMREYHIKNGNWNGKSLWWYESGQLEYGFNHKNGKRDGRTEFWHENGNR